MCGKCADGRAADLFAVVLLANSEGLSVGSWRRRVQLLRLHHFTQNLRLGDYRPADLGLEGFTKVPATFQNMFFIALLAVAECQAGANGHKSQGRKE